MSEASSPSSSLPFVIGAGLCRTGTMSLRAALNELGYKTMHMEELLLFGGNIPRIPWFDMATHARQGQDIQNEKLQMAKTLFLEQGFNATTDFPAALLYAELLQVQPNAKVILSIRSSPKVWSESVHETVEVLAHLLLRPPFSWIPHAKNFTNLLHPWPFEEIGVMPFGTADPAQFMDPADLERAYVQWIEQVKSTVPKEQLLIHESKNGFEPICRHIGIPMNDCPQSYPHNNHRVDFHRRLLEVKLLVHLFSPVVASCLLLLIFCVWGWKSGIMRQGQGRRYQQKSLRNSHSSTKIKPV